MGNKMAKQQIISTKCNKSFHANHPYNNNNNNNNNNNV
jgi:hypothetical protein